MTSTTGFNLDQVRANLPRLDSRLVQGLLIGVVLAPLFAPLMSIVIPIVSLLLAIGAVLVAYGMLGPMKLKPVTATIFVVCFDQNKLVQTARRKTLLAARLYFHGQGGVRARLDCGCGVPRPADRQSLVRDVRARRPAPTDDLLCRREAVLLVRRHGERFEPFRASCVAARSACRRNGGALHAESTAVRGGVARLRQGGHSHGAHQSQPQGRAAAALVQRVGLQADRLRGRARGAGRRRASAARADARRFALLLWPDRGDDNDNVVVVDSRRKQQRNAGRRVARRIAARLGEAARSVAAERQQQTARG